MLASESAGWLHSWLLGQPAWLLWMLCVAGIGTLVYGADKTVNSAVKLSRRLGMSTVLIGATVVSLGTTMPEMFTSVTAAFRGESGLALGNGVGSIICDTALIFGLCCLLTRLPMDRFVLNRHGWLQLGSGVLLAGVCGVLALLSGRLGTPGTENPGDWNVIPQWIGVVFILLLVGYLYLSVRWARQRPDLAAEAVEEAQGSGQGAAAARPAGSAVATAIVLVAGLALIALGSNVLIPAVKVLAEEHYHVPKDFLAVTLVALGTSLPELVTAIAAIVRGHKGLLVGNIIGADILNVLFVVGLSLCATDLEVPPTFYLLHLPVMLVVLGLLRLYIFISGPKGFSRWMGLPLLAVYAAYYVLLATFAGHLVGK
ncbi:hypothetical protein LCGC14_1885070 [marine sediment metagenome]|uniref:Sodium/calcium exchanger membrane region domain-containing protein n=1 Tax=marine sediment metagenome TaxID=412755 RepID=A0A0F9IF30_9ZZZZ